MSSFYLSVEHDVTPILHNQYICETELKIMFNLMESFPFFCVILFILIYLKMGSKIWIVQKIRNDYNSHSTSSGCRKFSH